MTSISNILSGNILSQPDNKAKATQENPLEALIKGAGGTTKDSKEQLSSYMLDLSEQAKAYLAQEQSPKKQETAPTLPTSFLLSSKERKQLQDIIEKYKDAPLTQETYKKIEAELKEKGLSPDQLAAKEQVKSFNATQIFLDAMSGTKTALSTEEVSASAQTKREDYTVGIIEYWASISTVEPEDSAA